MTPRSELAVACWLFFGVADRRVQKVVNIVIVNCHE